MAEFICHASVERTEAIFLDSCEKNGHTLLARKENQFHFRSGGSSLALQLDCKISSLSDNDYTARLEVYPYLTQRSQLFYVSFFLLSIALLITGLMVLPFWHDLYLWAGLMMFFLGMALFFLFNRLQHSAQQLSVQTISSIMHDVGQSIRVDQIRPVQFYIFRDVWKLLVILPMVIIVFSAALSYVFGIYIGLLAFLSLLVDIGHHFLLCRFIYGWQSVLSRIQNIWTSWCMGSGVMVTILVVVTCLQQATALNDKIMDVFDAFRCTSTFVLNSLTEENRSIEWDPRSAAIQIRRRVDAVLLKETRIQEGSQRAAVLDRRILDHFLFAVLVVPYVCGVIAIVLYGFRSLVKNTRDWKSKLANNHDQRGMHPELRYSRILSRTDRLLATSIFVISGIIHWLSVIVAIDAVAFLITGRCCILHLLSVAFSLFVINIEWSLGEMPAAIIATATLIVLALPGGMSLMIAGHKLTTIIKNEIHFLRQVIMDKATPYRDLNDWVTNIGGQLGLSGIRIEDNKDYLGMIFSESSLIGLGHRIVLSERIGQILSSEELRALLCHEVSHLREDAKRVALFKFLSAIFLCPFPYLLLIYDFAGREYRADSFAVHVIGDSSSMENALIKLSVSGVIASKGPKLKREAEKGGYRWRSLEMRMRKFCEVVLFYWKDSMFGAAYPFLQDRIIAIRSLRTNELNVGIGNER